MLRALGKSRFVRWGLGSILALYLRFVKRTNKIEFLPEDVYSDVEAENPVILTMWHGQHFMQTFYRKPWHRCHVMISRHGDGEINAIAAEKLGMLVVRGSGAQRKDQIQKRGGARALRTLLGLLQAGDNVSMTADVPKISRVAGDGIIALAQLSGRPIYPISAVCSRRIDFKSWDMASVGLPFGRTVITVGRPIRVARKADARALEAARRALEAELDRMYEAAYGRLGVADPGAGRESVRRARAARAAAAQARFVPEAALPETVQPMDKDA